MKIDIDAFSKILINVVQSKEMQFKAKWEVEENLGKLFDCDEAGVMAKDFLSMITIKILKNAQSDNPNPIVAKAIAYTGVLSENPLVPYIRNSVIHCSKDKSKIMTAKMKTSDGKIKRFPTRTYAHDDSSDIFATLRVGTHQRTEIDERLDMYDADNDESISSLLAEKGLTEQQIDLIQLCIVDGSNYEEIAQIHGGSESTYRKQVAQALKQAGLPSAMELKRKSR